MVLDLNKRKGQNYLNRHSECTVQGSLASMQISQIKDTILEIGAGIGTLSIPLAGNGW
jgi:16S rRNA A1518/A1519 N6-dimethyltransferase RsmA/KsgA/DIM1 with predicted DNA glycosylase/AP lyase activity